MQDRARSYLWCQGTTLLPRGDEGVWWINGRWDVMLRHISSRCGVRDFYVFSYCGGWVMETDCWGKGDR